MLARFDVLEELQQFYRFFCCCIKLAYTFGLSSSNFIDFFIKYGGIHVLNSVYTVYKILPRNLPHLWERMQLE